LADFARVTTIEYVLVVVPSCAVTTVVIVVAVPAARAIAPDAVPEVTATPLTFMVAFGSAAVGVTVTDAVALATDVVYVVVVPTVPVLVSDELGVSFMTLSEALAEPARVTIIEYVLVVDPFWAVTTVVIVVAVPDVKAIAPDAVPDVTVTPFTFMVAVGSAAVGVTVTDAVALAANEV